MTEADAVYDAARELLSELTGYPLRKGETLKSSPFIFVCYDGSVVDGTILLTDPAPESHVRLISDGQYFIEWRWRLASSDQGAHWSSPLLHCSYDPPRAGTFVLKPPSHFSR